MEKVIQDKLPHLLDFTCDAKILGLYKKVCDVIEFMKLVKRLHNPDFTPLGFEGGKKLA